MRRNSALFGLILILALFLFPGVSFGIEKAWGNYRDEIFSIGKGIIKDGNEAAAKEEAISQALIKGVEQYIILRLGNESVVKNFSRVIGEVLGKEREAVENFNILAEELTGDEYRVFVRIKINEKVLERKLGKAGILNVKGPALKVLFLVAETRGGSSSYWWGNPEIPSSMNATELLFNNKFRERGFYPTNRSQGIPAQEDIDDITNINLNDEGVVRWGNILSADIVIFGQTHIIKNEIVSLRIKVYKIKDSVLIFQTVEAEPIDDSLEKEKAIKVSIEKLVDNVVDVLTPIINRSVDSGKDKKNTVMLTLNGLRSYKQYKLFRDFLLNEIKGVKSVKQVRVRANAMSLAVEFEGERNELLDRLLGNEKLPFTISLEQTFGGDVILNVE
ncbi:hypothetical protein ACFL2O_04830 [Thermodesulfobacteriota bacterium]